MHATRARTDWALVAAVSLAAALRFPTLAAKGYWGDEISTVLLARDAPAALGRHVAALESTPPLYYLVASAWSRAFGSGELALRSLSALAGVALVPVAYATARALAGRRAALLAALLVACDPLLVWYSDEARAYELVALLSAVSLLLFLRARETGDRTSFVLWAAFSALALATHYFAVFIVAPEAVWLLCERRRAAVPAVAATAAAAAALAPLALHQRSLGHAAWIARTPLPGRAAAIPPELLTGFDMPWALVVGALALVPAGVGVAFARGGEAWRVAGALVAAGFALPLALALAGVDYLSTRNEIALAVPLLIVLAAGFASRRAGVAACGALCVLGLAVVSSTVDRPKYGSEAWRAAAHALGRLRAPRLVVAVPGQAARKPLLYYLPASFELRDRGAVVAEAELLALPAQGHTEPLAPPAARGLERLGFRLAGTRRRGVFVVVTLRAPSPRRVRPADTGAGLARLEPVALVER